MMRRRPDVWVTDRLADLVHETLPGGDRRVVADVGELPAEPFALDGSGWTLLTTVDLPGRHDDVLLAVARGVDLVIECDGGAESLLDELRHIATVHVDPSPEELRLRLAPEHRALLELVATGCSVAEAGHRVGISRRTAYRRLDEVGEMLGAVSTVDAIRRAGRAGLIPDATDEGVR